jgi:hypothetical protein
MVSVASRYPAPRADVRILPKGTLFNEVPTSGAGGGGSVEQTAAESMKLGAEPQSEVISAVVMAFDQRYTF